MLNLFLGDQVLPSHTLSCTATLCEICYGEEWSGRATKKNGDEIVFRREDIDQYVFKRVQREEPFEHDRVELKWSSPILKVCLIL